MRTDWSHLEKFRITHPVTDPWMSYHGERHGAFVVRKASGTLRIIATAGDQCLPWEHVSVSLAGRCPTWGEMAYVKSLFWRPDETVMQLHVPDADHKNYHPYCLHLWRPLNAEIPRPPSIAVAT